MMQTLSSLPVAAHTAQAGRTARGNYVLLRADTLRLLLPQSDIQSTNYMQTRPEPVDGESGLLHMPGSDDGAVYVALSSDMRLLDACPSDRFVSTRLQGDVDVQWCWSEVRVLMDTQLSYEAVPPVLLAPHTPVHEMAAVGDEWAYLCSAEVLQQFALSQEGKAL